MATARQGAPRPNQQRRTNGQSNGQKSGGQQRQRGGYSTGGQRTNGQGNGQGGGYSVGKGGGDGTHPAHAYSGVASAEGHFRYCYRLIQHARDGRAGVQMAYSHLRSEIMRASQLTPAEKKYLIRRLRREYRGLSASFNAQARRAARTARVRQDADMHIASGAEREKEMNGRGGWARRIG